MKAKNCGSTQVLVNGLLKLFAFRPLYPLNLICLHQNVPYLPITREQSIMMLISRQSEGVNEIIFSKVTLGGYTSLEDSENSDGNDKDNVNDTKCL